MRTDRLGKEGPALERLRGGVTMVALACLVLIIIICLVTKNMLQSNDREDARKVQLAQYEPQTALAKFYLERNRTTSFRDDACRGLLDFMSQDDLSWFDRNTKRLASLNPLSAGSAAQGLSEDEQKGAALEVLIPFGAQAQRPVIAQVQAQGIYAVAFVHEPDQPLSLRHVFLVREGGLWKIRRFLGERDSPRVMDKLIQNKKYLAVTLDPDEIQYLAKPAEYADQLEASMLREAGIDPLAAPAPAAGR